MAITTLDIINQSLSAIDLPPVNSVNEDSYEVQEITKVLNQQKHTLLSKGYFFNTVNQEFVSTNSDEVYLPDSVLKISNTDYALRNKKLFDLKNNTDKIKLTQPLTLETVVSLDIEDLPYEAAYYIMKKTITNVQTKLMPDIQTSQVYKQEELEAKRLFTEYILESYGANMIDNVSSIWQR